MTMRNLSNNSILTTKRKSFDDHDTEGDLLKFVLLQASTLEKMLPQVLDESLFD